jgi:hypothetical protein
MTAIRARLTRVIPPRAADLVDVQDRIQDASARSNDEVDKDQNKSEILEAATLEKGYVNRVQHGRGYKVQGWRIVYRDSLTAIKEQESTSDSTSLDLITLGDCVVDIEVW